MLVPSAISGSLRRAIQQRKSRGEYFTSNNACKPQSPLARASHLTVFQTYCIRVPNKPTNVYFQTKSLNKEEQRCLQITTVARLLCCERHEKQLHRLHRKQWWAIANPIWLKMIKLLHVFALFSDYGGSMFFTEIIC